MIRNECENFVIRQTLGFFKKMIYEGLQRFALLSNNIAATKKRKHLVLA